MGAVAEEINPEDWVVGPQAASNDLRAVHAKEVRTMDKKSSWMRIAITIAIDWRFVTALVILVLTLLLKQ